MPVHAVIDIGSNSLKIRIARRDDADGSVWEVLEDRVVVTGLGRGLATERRLREREMIHSLSALDELLGRARMHGATTVTTVGTMCLRRAPNGIEFRDRAREEVGVEVEILTGEEEARLSYLGAASSLPEIGSEALMIDIGGGSTEFMVGRAGDLVGSLSLDVGTLHPTGALLVSDPVSPRELAAAADWITSGLAPAAVLATAGVVVGIGGTAATLAAVRLGRWRGAAAAVHGHRVMAVDVDAQIERYWRLPVAARRGLPGLPPDRADVILAGALVMKAVLTLASADSFTVSVHGLRQGVLEERFGPSAGLRHEDDLPADPP